MSVYNYLWVIIGGHSLSRRDTVLRKYSPPVHEKHEHVFSAAFLNPRFPWRKTLGSFPDGWFLFRLWIIVEQPCFVRSDDAI